MVRSAKADLPVHLDSRRCKEGWIASEQARTDLVQSHPSDSHDEGKRRPYTHGGRRGGGIPQLKGDSHCQGSSASTVFGR